MALAYRSITAEQDSSRNLFPKGEYAFTVKSIEEKLCKNKINHMLVVQLVVMNAEGRTLNVTDWIMLDMEDFEWKLRHFAATCGLLHLYDDNMLEARHFVNAHGVAKLNVQDYEKDGELLKTNRVVDYVKPGQAKPVAQAQQNDGSFVDDDIPL